MESLPMWLKDRSSWVREEWGRREVKMEIAPVVKREL